MAAAPGTGTGDRHGPVPATLAPQQLPSPRRPREGRKHRHGRHRGCGTTEPRSCTGSPGATAGDGARSPGSFGQRLRGQPRPCCWRVSGRGGCSGRGCRLQPPVGVGRALAPGEPALPRAPSQPPDPSPSPADSSPWTGGARVPGKPPPPPPRQPLSRGRDPPGSRREPTRGAAAVAIVAVRRTPRRGDRVRKPSVHGRHSGPDGPVRLSRSRGEGPERRGRGGPGAGAGPRAVNHGARPPIRARAVGVRPVRMERGRKARPARARSPPALPSRGRQRLRAMPRTLPRARTRHLPRTLLRARASHRVLPRTGRSVPAAAAAPRRPPAMPVPRRL
ncbi:collagen alpha-1(II) chain-like [Melozone crissalis]|uniref:collagen alpha-1(II) chain-like n=1 Tax=Melozone crissalis TaxID=40204 RepID=UPI0023DC459A|nr:collagen alpha-1(II) chain-like [Melozone crissalis]